MPVLNIIRQVIWNNLLGELKDSKNTLKNHFILISQIRVLCSDDPTLASDADQKPDYNIPGVRDPAFQGASRQIL